MSKPLYWNGSVTAIGCSGAADIHVLSAHRWQTKHLRAYACASLNNEGEKKLAHITFCAMEFPAKWPLTGPSCISWSTFSDSYVFRHLSKTPLLCFLQSTSCTNWYAKAFKHNDLFCLIEKWEGMVPCSRYRHISAYQEVPFFMGAARFISYISISCSQLTSSSSLS